VETYSQVDTQQTEGSGGDTVEDNRLIKDRGEDYQNIQSLKTSSM